MMFKTDDPRQAFRLYERLGGEAESRLIESRRNMLPYDRKVYYPYDPDYFKQATGVWPEDLILQPNK